MTPTALRGLTGANSTNGKISNLPRLGLDTPALVPRSLDEAYKKLIDIDPNLIESIEISRYLVDQQARQSLDSGTSNANSIQWTLLDTLTDEDQTYLDHDKALIAHLKRLDAYVEGDEETLSNREVYHGPDAWSSKEDRERVWQAQCTPGLYCTEQQHKRELPFFSGRIKALQLCQSLFEQMKASPEFSKEFDENAKQRGLVVLTAPVNMTWARDEKLAHGEFVKQRVLPGARYIVDTDKAAVQQRGEVNGGVILDDKPNIPPHLAKKSCLLYMYALKRAEISPCEIRRTHLT